VSLRNLQRRMAKLEKGAKPKPSPIIILYGSWDAFIDGAYAAVSAGTLDPEFLDLVDTLRAWDRGMVWALAYAR
jgi:hypothetical protein